MFGHSAVIADRLSSWGYVTLAVDSFGPRGLGIANRCGRGLPDQAFDAYAALRYLSQLDFVACDRACLIARRRRRLGRRPGRISERALPTNPNQAGLDSR